MTSGYAGCCQIREVSGADSASRHVFVRSELSAVTRSRVNEARLSEAEPGERDSSRARA